ncbi:MAG: signal peptidase II [Planctomycetota bacterium]
MRTRGTEASDGKSVPHAQKPAWRSPLPIAVFLAIAILGLVADLWSKHVVFDSLLSAPRVAQRVEQVRRAVPPDTPPDEVLRYVRAQRRLMPGVKLTLSTNPGVVFGFKPHESAPTRKLIVTLATGLCMVLVLVFFGQSHRNAWLSHVGLALILAGALGNLYDRTVAKVYLPGMPGRPITGQVRDFVDASELYYKYIFNIADVWLVVGVGLLMLHWFLNRKENSAQAA